MSLCRISFFFSLDWKSFKLKRLELRWIHRLFFLHLESTVSAHWSLKSSMATVTATAPGTNSGSAWRTEQHSAVIDKALEKYDQLMNNSLRIDQLAYETVSTVESLAPILSRLETAELNDLLFITQCITAVKSNCEELKSTALSTEWPPTTLVPGSMADGLYGLRYTIPTPESPCNSFALATLHCRRCENWRSLKTAEILFPSCRLPHYSYTEAEFNCYRVCRPENVEILTGVAFMGDVVTTGQTAQTVCFATTLRTATEILNTGVIPTSLFTNGQVNCWFTPRSALLRAFQMHWTGITLALDEPLVLVCYNPSLHRFLATVSETVETLTSFNVFTMTIVGLLTHLMRSCHWTALRAVLVLASNCLLLPGSLWKHWKLSWTAINRLEFTAEDLLDTASSLSINSNWPTKMFSLTALGRASTLMRHCPSGRRTSLLHKLRLNKLTQLARSTWRSLVFQSALMRWLWLSLAATETEYDIVIFDALFLDTAMLTKVLKSWKQVHWRCYL